jgi:hypothetical protein
MNTYEKAKYEFELMEIKFIKDPTETTIVLEFETKILDLVRAFGESGQSGASAPYVAEIISSTVKKLCLHKPLSPLTGEDSEWRLLEKDYEYDQTDHYQNIRDTSVFKDSKGKCYCVDAVIFQGEEEYDTFTGTVEEVHSNMNIKKFPFEPQKFYIDVVKVINLNNPKEYDYIIADRNQLKAVYDIFESRY